MTICIFSSISSQELFAQVFTWNASQTVVRHHGVKFTLEYRLQGCGTHGEWTGTQRFSVENPIGPPYQSIDPIQFTIPEGAGRFRLFKHPSVQSNPYFEWYGEISGNTMTFYNVPGPLQLQQGDPVRWRITAPIQRMEGRGEQRAIQITQPSRDERFSFDSSNPGILSIVAVAQMNIQADPASIEWEFPQIEGNSPQLNPASGRGTEVRARYQGLPARNDSFGRHTIIARVGPQGCASEDRVDVSFFFQRDANNHSATSAEERNEPNWYYYWKQTGAFVGPGRYHGRSEKCNPAGDHYYGYHRYDLVRETTPRIAQGRGHYYICDLSTHDFSYECAFKEYCNTLEGIDCFAVVSHHENLHYQHWIEWWRPLGGWPIDMGIDRNNDGRIQESEILDRDTDKIPDSLEPRLGFDPSRTLTHPVFNEDIDRDEEYLTRRTAEATQRAGSVNNEDWACPGHQWRDCSPVMDFTY